MINKSQGRARWIGASDTRYVMSNFDTKSFELWWLEKLGIRESDYISESMAAGTNYEHRILDFLSGLLCVELIKDEQIKIRKYRLRVNYDGTTSNLIVEVKTHSANKPYVVSKQHFEQVQVEMYVKRIKTAKIASYALTDDDYNNYFNPIDGERIKLHDVEYDASWIDEKYLPRLRYLSKCLIRHSIPNIQEFLEETNVLHIKKELR